MPQCGFSASATNLYSSRLISIGTLIAVYLSTSDEMIPIFISEAMPVSLMFEILGIKLILGVFWGFVVDFIFRKFIMKKHSKNEENTNIQSDEVQNDAESIGEMCEDEHCHCHEQGIFKASLIHTLNITVYIFIITLVIGLVIGLIGEDTIETFIKKNILGANSEYEEEIEQQLLRINEMVPNLVSAYFDFPTEWEENGLADLVRNLYKVSK